VQGRNWILLGIAVLIGLVAVILANSYFSGVEQQQQQIAQKQRLVRIVVATQQLEFGTKLTQQNTRLQNWPADSVPQGAFTSIPEVLKNNRVALRAMVPGEPVLASNVSGTDGRATLAALLPAGMRAISIPVDAVNGVAGFVLPGTMVDVLLTRQIEGDGATNGDQRADLILENVQVLAIDQQANDKEGKPKVGRTATLALSLFDAQRIAVAQRMGTLRLVLRKVEDAAGAEGLAEAGKYTRTVTSRQLGLPRLVIAARRQPPAVQQASIAAPAAALAGSFAAPAIRTGPSMTVVRGTEPTSYTVGNLGGW
jgi:pilus assembly protein CpaB